MKNHDLVLSLQETMRHHDEQAKRILSYKKLQAPLLKMLLEEFNDIPTEKICQYIEPERSYDRIVGLNVEDQKVKGHMVRYDSLYELEDPVNRPKTILINIEAQGQDPGYSLVRRGIYQVGHLLAGQRNDPIGFLHSSFDDMHKVISIWLCMHHARYKDGCINEYIIRQKHLSGSLDEGKDHYELIRVYMVYLRKGTRRVR